MATVTITTTPTQDAALKRAADTYNATNPSQLTTLQFAIMLVNNMLDAIVARYGESDTLNRVALYQKASDTDKATIDAILSKYQ